MMYSSLAVSQTRPRFNRLAQGRDAGGVSTLV
jgi:hypothetical protein